LVYDPEQHQSLTFSRDEFEKLYQGKVILVTSRATVVGELAKFDFSWFIPSVVKYRRILLEVLTVSAFIQFLALITPLFFQVVMDKVLVHRGFSTLNIITIAFIIVILFEVILTGARTY
ncbi:hypothetical protein AAY07_005414, partial [Escherichia coli]